VKKYVVGFLFSPGLDWVVLIEKKRPKWQVGLLNGVGGHIEADELSYDAMVREFEEEAGIANTTWKHFAIIRGKDLSVNFYASFDDVMGNIKQMTDERLCITEVAKLPKNVIHNLRWLIPLALDKEVVHPVVVCIK
jgi:8-oxo-dGTP diphosphatase